MATSTDTTNVNNCATCHHKKHPDGGWCYIFREEPKEICLQHSARITADETLISLALLGGFRGR